MVEVVPQSAIETRHLRRAIEFAVRLASEGQKVKPPMPSPAALRKFAKVSRIPATGLTVVRRAIEADGDYRTKMALAADGDDSVDEVGRLWLAQPAGWQAQAQELIAAATAATEQADAAKDLKRAERRRDAAEQGAARAQAEIVILRSQVIDRETTIDGMQAEAAKLRDELAEVRTELSDTRVEARHARDREASAVAKLDAAEHAEQTAARSQDRAEMARDELLADRVSWVTEQSELASLAAAAQGVAARLSSLSWAGQRADQASDARRSPVPLPGGVLGKSSAAAEYLLNSGASVLIDGYNVSKLAWPTLELKVQREILLDEVENLARRFRCDLTVIFDGAAITGATADRRRVIRVVYSPPDVIADDVIRDEVERLPITRPVVVVTNDQEIIRDVKAKGANTLASEQLVALF